METILTIYSLPHHEMQKYVKEYKYKYFPSCDTASTDYIRYNYHTDDFSGIINVIDCDGHNVYFTNIMGGVQISCFGKKELLKKDLFKNKKNIVLRAI